MYPGEGSIHLHIPVHNAGIGPSPTGGGVSPIIVQPQTIYTENTDNTKTTSMLEAPEKKLTLFALRLAVLEKAATGLGTLGFIWATVVLLGGFEIALGSSDFWFITIILLIEGARIFSRSRELEWQHQATWSFADAGINSFKAIRSSSHFIIKAIKAVFKPIEAVHKPSLHDREVTVTPQSNKTLSQIKLPSRTWMTLDVPLLPYAPWIFLSKNFSRILYWLQLGSAVTCVDLSLLRLIKHNFGEEAKEESDTKNREFALFIFYGLALAEALLFLLEKAYWEWEVMYRKVLEEVNNEFELGPSGTISIRRFFYDAYSKCVNGCIFDGIRMDLISFAMELLCSNSQDEQTIGTQILRQFSLNQQFSDGTLQKIGVTISVIERLVEMLNWKDPEEEEIRKSAAQILSKLAGKKQNSLRVAGIPGAMESISSLLQVSRMSDGSADGIHEKKIIFDDENYGHWAFNNLGLLILKKLARDHDNSGKIGNTRGLLPKIIDFTHAEERLLKDESATSSQILSVKRSLQVVKMLASTTGTNGKQLRQEISEVVFTISNIRDILKYGEKHPVLQKLGIEILTCLALEEDSTERIGETGGVLKELLNIFLQNGVLKNRDHVRIAAGEALGMLASESRSNCHRFINLKVVDKLVDALEVPLLRIGAARILKNLCTYSQVDYFRELRGIHNATPTVLRAIMTEKDKLQEVMVGLAAHAFKFMTSQESSAMFARAGIQETELARTLVHILKKYPYPSIKVPRIRRFTTELMIWMMKNNKLNITVFKDLGVEKELESVAETTSELESFKIFSGTVGLRRHKTTIHSLVENAMELLEDK